MRRIAYLDALKCHSILCVIDMHVIPSANSHLIFNIVSSLWDSSYNTINGGTLE